MALADWERAVQMVTTASVTVTTEYSSQGLTKAAKRWASALEAATI